MSDSEYEESFGEIDESEYKNNKQRNENKTGKDIEMDSTVEGRKYTHFLPFKIPFTGECKVNVYFDPLIEPRYKNDDNSEEYTTSYRGRIFNGKKIIINPDEYTFNKISYTNKKGTLTVKNVEEMNNIYLWKFDEEIEHNNSLTNMNHLLKSLDILK